MRGINRVIISGNVTGEANFSTLGNGTRASSFTLASDRHSRGDVITAYVRINVYIDALTDMIRERLRKGDYVIVEGELMNRNGIQEELTEVRAREIVFLPSRGG
jgi:single-stranded DNA-binding protein